MPQLSDGRNSFKIRVRKFVGKVLLFGDFGVFRAVNEAEKGIPLLPLCSLHYPAHLCSDAVPAPQSAPSVCSIFSYLFPLTYILSPHLGYSYLIQTFISPLSAEGKSMIARDPTIEVGFYCCCLNVITLMCFYFPIFTHSGFNYKEQCQWGASWNTSSPTYYLYLENCVIENVY